MRKLFILLCAFAVLTLSGAANAQGVRIGNASSAPVSTATLLSTKVLVPVPSAVVQFCLAPASGVPCVNKATTYSDATLVTPCATSTQVVLDGTTSCVAATDSLGNWGVWVPAGVQYAYTFTSMAGNFGPYYVTGSIVSGVQYSGSILATQVPFGTALNMISGSSNFTWDNTNKSLTVTNSGSSGNAAIYGQATGVTVNDSGIVGSCQQLGNFFCQGGQFTASDSGAGPIGSLVGLSAIPSHLAAGTLASITGVDVSSIVGGGTGAITASRGIHVGGTSFPVGTSPVTHDGIKIDDQCAGSFPATTCTGLNIAAQGNAKPGIVSAAKLVDVIGGVADPLSNVNTIANFKLYSVNPLTQPQATQFHQIDVSGNHTGGNGAFGADMVQFNQARIHDTTGTWPAFWEMQAGEFEAEAFGTCAAPCGTTLPSFRLVSLGAQSHVRDSGADTIIIPYAYDVWGLGPFRDSSSATSRPGTITVTNGSTAVTGAGTNFAAGDVGKFLWVAPNNQNGSLAMNGCTLASVTNAITAACTSNWTWITTASNYWNTTAITATGPGGSTSSITNALSGYFGQSIAGTSTNYAVQFDGQPGHTEQSVGAVWATNGVQQWVVETENNANTASGDWVLRDFIPSANTYAMRFRNPGNDGASQKGNVFINASGPGGRVFIGGPMPIFPGEGASANMGTGGLAVSTGGTSGSNAAVAASGVIAIPFNQSIKACNSTCAADISLVTTSGTNDVTAGDAVNANHLLLSAATDIQVNQSIHPGVAGANDLGLTGTPFGNLWLGTAATNNFKFQPAATAAARVISIPDPLAAENLALIDTMTVNFIPKAASSSTSRLSPSLESDNGTTMTYTGTGGYSAPQLVSTVATGTAPLTVTSTTAVANLKVQNLSAVSGGNLPLAAGGTDVGSTALPYGNLWLGTAATNNFKFQPAATSGARIITMADPLSPTTVALPLTIGSGTTTLTANAALAAVTAQAANTTAATGVLTTDAIEWSFASAPTAGDSLCHVLAYVTAGNVNFVRANPTAAPQNVSALVVNWRVIR